MSANEIFDAIESGEYSRVKELLRFTNNLELRNAAGYTPLLFAVSRGPR